MGRVIAYCRVSTRDQNPQMQLDALTAHGYDLLYEETVSSRLQGDRPRFAAAVAELAAGDTLLFWKSDRWGRTAAHVLTVTTELRERGVRVVSLTESFDLDTKEGRLMFGVLALASEYELELRAERQADGIAAAKRRQAEGRMLPGKQHLGRPPVMGPAELRTLRQLVAGGESVTAAARTLKIGRSTAYEALAKSGGVPERDQPGPVPAADVAQPAPVPPGAAWEEDDICLTRDDGQWRLHGPDGDIHVEAFGLFGSGIAAGHHRIAQQAAAAAITELTGRPVTYWYSDESSSSVYGYASWSPRLD